MTPVRLMTWNVRGSAGPDLAALAAAVASFEPDVLAIQEIRARQARRLARRLGYHRRWALKHFPYGVLLWWRAEGLAVLSPHPLQNRHRYVLSPGVHSWTYRRRIALAVTVRLPELAVRVFDAHLGNRAAPSELTDQATILAGRIAEERQRAEEAAELFKSVVIGDLNTHDEPEVLAPLVATGFVDAWTIAEHRSEGEGSTSPTTGRGARIDYVLVETTDRSLRVEVPTAGTAWARLSDHFPVMATVQFG